eukprot:6196957-Pyramimonas_sp.AAC.1
MPQRNGQPRIYMSSCFTSIRWRVIRDIVSHRIIDIIIRVTVPYPTSCHIPTHLGRGNFVCRRVALLVVFSARMVPACKGGALLRAAGSSRARLRGHR